MSKILIIKPNPAVRDNLAFHLRAEGYQVLNAGDGVARRMTRKRIKLQR